MRVLCVNDLPAGGSSGTEVHLALLADGLRRQGDEVEVFCRPPRTGAARVADAYDPASRRALERAVRTFRPEILHFHNVVRELSVSVLGAAPELPRVMTVHDGRLLGDADGAGPALRLWQRRVRAPLDAAVSRRRVGVTLAVSEALRDRLQRAGFRHVRHVAPWAAAPTAALSRPDRSHDLLFLGRLEPAKGFDVLLTAFGELAVRHPSARLLVAGAGGLQPVLDAAAAAWPGRIVPLGVLGRAEVSRRLATARAVVLPSRSPEGTPLALVEGLVHGRPLVVSDVAGVLEVAGVRTPSPAGLASAAGDAASLAAALGRLLDDDELVRRLAAAADDCGAAYSEEAGLGRVRECYRLAGAP